MLKKRPCSKVDCPFSVSGPWLYRLLQKRKRTGLSIQGHVHSEIGLGRAVRLLVKSFDSAGLPISITDIPLDGRQNEPELANRVGPAKGYGASLTVSGIASLEQLGENLCRRQVNIAYPFWELSSAPANWAAFLEKFDAFWAPSVFIREMLEACQQRPVHLFRQPVELPAEPQGPRRPDGVLRLMTFLDFDSFVTRKNPLGALNAFKLAFKPQQKDVELVIKVRGGNDHGMRSLLRDAASKDQRVKWIDGTVSRGEIASLLAMSDVFISLHRSEGFGFGCAEALAAGKIVVATDYSGTTDFITAETGFPIAWRPLAVGEKDYIGTDGAFWAEPEIEDAAAKLSEIADAPDAAYRRALAGFRLLKQNHSFDVAGQRALEILRQMGLS
jgi:glycosyltransferase involved in cell wall biosynthesis